MELFTPAGSPYNTLLYLISPYSKAKRRRILQTYWSRVAYHRNRRLKHLLPIIRKRCGLKR